MKKWLKKLFEIKREPFYQEGFIKLDRDNMIIDFKKRVSTMEDSSDFTVIDMYDNKIVIPYKNILYIFYHKNSKANHGRKKMP